MFGLIESYPGEPSDRNIYVFLTMDELLGLKSHKLSGKLAGIETELPEYSVVLEVKKQPRSNVLALEIETSGTAYHLTINSRSYPDLLRDNVLSGRFGNFFKYDLALIECIREGEELYGYLDKAKKKCCPNKPKMQQ
jgi:hypothetical protein